MRCAPTADTNLVLHLLGAQVGARTVRYPRGRGSKWPRTHLDGNHLAGLSRLACPPAMELPGEIGGDREFQGTAFDKEPAVARVAPKPVFICCHSPRSPTWPRFRLSGVSGREASTPGCTRVDLLRLKIGQAQPSRPARAACRCPSSLAVTDIPIAV